MRRDDAYDVVILGAGVAGAMMMPVGRASWPFFTLFLPPSWTLPFPASPPLPAPLPSHVRAVHAPLGLRQARTRQGSARPSARQKLAATAAPRAAAPRAGVQLLDALAG